MSTYAAQCGVLIEAALGEMMRSPQGWAPTDSAAGTSHRSVARRRGIAGAAITAIVAASLAAGTLAPASASLAGPMGAVDPVNGFPSSFSDGRVALGQCLDGPQCLVTGTQPNPGAAVSFPDNFPEEHFWYAASAVNTAQPALYEAALKGTLLTPADGQQTAFARLRIQMDGLTPNATYTVRHPYGVETLSADPNGAVLATTDTGCLDVPCTPVAFANARAGFMGDFAGTPAPSCAMLATCPWPSFLTQTNPAPGFIGDINVPGTVTGAPSGLNAVVVTGPNAGGLGVNTFTVSQFNVQGKLVGAAVTPTTPVSPNAIAGRSSALVRWAAPGNGGSAITGYTIKVVNGITGAQIGALRSITAAKDTSSNSLNVTGLTGGIAVRFVVQARNAVGASAFSPGSNRVTPLLSTPGAAVIQRANPGARGGAITAKANWTPPASTGGSAINGYQVTALRLSATGRVMSSRTSVVQHFSARSLSMTLQPGNYRFVVRARNRLGYGVYSSRSTLVTAR